MESGTLLVESRQVSKRFTQTPRMSMLACSKQLDRYGGVAVSQAMGKASLSANSIGLECMGPAGARRQPQLSIFPKRPKDMRTL